MEVRLLMSAAKLKAQIYFLNRQSSFTGADGGFLAPEEDREVESSRKIVNSRAE